MNPAPRTATVTRTVPLADGLAGHGDRVALITPDGAISYRDLATRVEAVAWQLGPQPRLVLLASANEVYSVVVYLAALSAGHPVLLAAGDRPEALESLIEAYDPDVIAGGSGDEWRLDERREVSTHTPHPELALLLTTSGSTGSPKLVRLSHDNLQSNAEAIADYLDIRPDDRAATTLPMHYCYGLSVINGHLARGASLLLTDRSVTDAEFWRLFTEHRATSFAGVPYTFDLLDRVGFDRMNLPDLRYVTQAGGRLAPERVRHYAGLGRRDGWELFVMYGQTEATARMAYLPPHLAEAHPESIGVPIPGGTFRLEPLADWPEPGTGELVYEGPNVMLGYAETAADLERGPEISELRTGDVARRTADGLYQVVGRRSRFVKLFGLRIDLQRVEALLERRGFTGACAGTDDTLVVAVQGPDSAADSDVVRRLVARECGLPVGAVRAHVVAELPRLPSGKPDYATVHDLDRRAAAPPAAVPPAAPPGTPPWQRRARPSSRADLRRAYAEVLGRSDVTDDSTFVGLGGDSLSYVELSIRLEQALGQLPDQWHTTPIRDLRPAARVRWRARGTLEIGVALRAVAIVLIVGTHATLFPISGGAHVLLGVAGYNFARFHLTAAPRLDRLRHIGRGIRRLALASMTFILLAYLLTDDYGLANVFLLHEVVGSEQTRNGWHFWFIESLVYIQVATLPLVALPVVDRLERRFPFGLPVALAALGLVTRYELIPGVELGTPLVVFWLFALGWAAAKATTGWQRLLVSVMIVATVPGFFPSTPRVAVIIAGLLLLVWVTRIPSVPLLNRPVGLLAGASLFIYLTHWQVYPHLYGFSPLLAVAASLVVGVLYGLVVARAAGKLWRPVRRALGGLRHRVAGRSRPYAHPVTNGDSPDDRA